MLIDAAERLRTRERLLIVIVGDGSKREALQRTAAARGLTNVRFLPYQPKERLHESFAAADAFLVSLKPGIEGYIVPSKVYGILAAGRPYVAAVDPSCEVATIAREHGCGICAVPDDPEDLARRLRRCTTIRKRPARWASAHAGRHGASTEPCRGRVLRPLCPRRRGPCRA